MNIQTIIKFLEDYNFEEFIYEVTSLVTYSTCLTDRKEPWGIHEFQNNSNTYKEWMIIEKILDLEKCPSFRIRKTK